MKLDDLFETGVIKLRGFGKPATETRAMKFMDELRARTEASMFNERQRVIGQAVVEVTRSINDRANAVHLTDIMSRTPGEGSKAMEFLCEMADRHRVSIDLIAKGYADTPTAKLVEWYQRYGFEKEHDVEDDDPDGVDMIRRPQA